MKENLKDILSNLSPEVDQETLLSYLQGQLSSEKQHEVEQHLIDQPFDEDALEGLQQIKDKQQIAYMVEMLNRDLQKKLPVKNKDVKSSGCLISHSFILPSSSYYS